MATPKAQTKKRTPLGPRVSVEFGTAGKAGKTQSKKAFVRMLESTAKLFGFSTAQDSALQRKRKDGSTITLRGEKSVSIKVPTGKKVKSKSGVQRDQLKQMPVPASANLTQIKTFLRKAKSKPKYFVSPDGRQHSLNTGAKTK